MGAQSRGMRKAFFIVLALSIAACGSGGDDNGSPTEPGTAFDVAVGDSFTVRLESNPSTGFSWALVEDPPDAVVVLTGENYIDPNTSLVGAPGIQEFTFEAAGPGSTSIDLWYVRPFDDPPQPADEVSFPVTVSG